MAKPASPEQEVAALLQRLGVAHTVRPKVAGIEVDFAVQFPRHERLLIETKRWEPTEAAATRAARQARIFRKLTGLRTFVVIPDLADAGGAGPALGLAGLARVLASSTKVTPRLPAHKAPAKRAKAIGARPLLRARPASTLPKAVVFAAMPFAAAYDDVFFVAIVGAARALPATAVRVDVAQFNGDVVAEIETDIRRCDLVIADLSEAKANVMYETGFAHALGKPVVHISSTELSALPFDVRNWNTIPYLKGQTHRLRSQLTRRLKAALRS